MKIQTGKIPIILKELKKWAKRNCPPCKVFNLYCAGCRTHRAVADFICYVEEHEDTMRWLEKQKLKK